MYEELAVLSVFTFIYSVISGRVEKMAISGPIIFVCVGLVFSPLGLDWFKDDVSRIEFRVLIDLTLALILFIDAACRHIGPAPADTDSFTDAAGRTPGSHRTGIRCRGVPVRYHHAI